MQFPASELRFWSVVFSVEDDARDPAKLKSLTSKPHRENAHEEVKRPVSEAKDKFKEWLS